MKKPIRSTLTLRTQDASVGQPVCYALDGTELVFSEKAALICHKGTGADTEADIAENVDALLVDGAFEALRANGKFMERDEHTLNEPSQFYTLSVDPAMVAAFDAQRLAFEAAQNQDVSESPENAEPQVQETDMTNATIAAGDGFQDDTVFQQTPQQAVAEQHPVETMKSDDAKRPAQETETFDIDLTAAEVKFDTTRNGAPFATIRMPGQRTHMAFGELAEYLRDKNNVSGEMVKGRSTNKIIAIRVAGSDDLIVELPRAA